MELRTLDRSCSSTGRDVQEAFTDVVRRFNDRIVASADRTGDPSEGHRPGWPAGTEVAGMTFTIAGTQRTIMETPTELEAAAESQDEITITKRDYDGETTIAVDFGPVAGEPTVDIVDETAIVVVDGEQFEFDIPADATEVTVNDSILTITS